MAFHCVFMIFDGFGCFLCFFQGGFMLFMVLDWLLWFFKVFSWYFMTFSWFSWFFKVVFSWLWFFKVVFGRSPCFSQGNFMVSYFIWKVSVFNAEKARKCTHSNFIKAQLSNLGLPAVGQE